MLELTSVERLVRGTVADESLGRVFVQGILMKFFAPFRV
jgi:hypothetical protein